MQSIKNDNNCKESEEDLLIENLESKIEKTLEGIKLVKSDLKKEKKLIGFAGGPWTVALYIIEGK